MQLGTIGALGLAMAFAVPAAAEITIVNGTLAPGATFNRPVGGTPPTVLSGVGTAVFFDTYSFQVSAAGSYSINLDSLAFDTFLVLYQGAFDPSLPLLNAISADDDGGPGLNSLIIASLMTGVDYIAVATSFSNGATGAYTFTFDGPGSVFVPGGNGVIPEPATWAMLIVGFGLVGGALRRRTVDKAAA